MKYKFSINNENFDIEISNDITFYSESKIRVNGKGFNILIGEKSKDEVKSFFVDNKLYHIEIEKDSEGYPVGIYVNSEYFPVKLKKIDRLFYFEDKRVESQMSGIVKSFIPGSIKEIYFQEGDKVEEGDIVLIHEAMKMENEIKAPRSGVIKKIGVKIGDNILANHLLFEIE